MNFQLSEEQKLLIQSIRDFANNNLLPGVIERDEKQEFTESLRREMAELGLMGMMVSPKYGGGGMDTLSYLYAVKEISKVDASAAVIMSVNNSLVCWGLENYANEQQKEKYLKALASGDKIGAFCLSEPEAGSDASAQRTTAILQGDHYILNGIKNWITNASSAEYYIVFAQTDREKKHKGINAFIVEKSWEGVVVNPKENKMGIRASDTHSISFTDVKIPIENRIGEDGFGFSFAMQALAGGRIGIAAQAIGIATGAYELALAYAKERQTFGKPIIKHQGIGFKLAKMKTDIDAAELLCCKAAWLKDNKMDYSVASAQAKWMASEVAMNGTIEAVQIHGGYGFVKEYHVERHMRDAKITQIYEGTSEIQQLIIARSLGK